MINANEIKINAMKADNNKKNKNKQRLLMK